MTKKGLQAELAKLGVSFKSRDTKDTLEALLKGHVDDNTTVADKSDIKNHSQDPAESRTTRGPSTKDVIRGMFPKVGATIARDALFEALANVKPETVTTMLGDLKNEKYCGSLGPIAIEREGDEFTRVH